MDHPMIGQTITFDLNGIEIKGTIDKAKPGPFVADGESKVGSAKVQSSVQFHVVPENSGKPFWTPPVIFE